MVLLFQQDLDYKSYLNPRTSWEIMCREGEQPLTLHGQLAFQCPYVKRPLSAPVKLLSGQHQITVVIVGSSPVCLPQKGAVSCVWVGVCVALWATCFMCDSCVTGMCLGQVTGETLQGNHKRLDHSLSLPVFFLSFFIFLFLHLQSHGDTLLTDCLELEEFCVLKRFILYLRYISYFCYYNSSITALRCMPYVCVSIV